MSDVIVGNQLYELKQVMVQRLNIEKQRLRVAEQQLTWTKINTMMVMRAGAQLEFYDSRQHGSSKDMMRAKEAIDIADKRINELIDMLPDKDKEVVK